MTKDFYLAKTGLRCLYVNHQADEEGENRIFNIAPGLIHRRLANDEIVNEISGMNL